MSEASEPLGYILESLNLKPLRPYFLSELRKIYVELLPWCNSIAIIPDDETNRLCTQLSLLVEEMEEERGTSWLARQLHHALGLLSFGTAEPTRVFLAEVFRELPSNEAIVE